MYWQADWEEWTSESMHTLWMAVSHNVLKIIIWPGVSCQKQERHSALSSCPMCHEEDTAVQFKWCLMTNFGQTETTFTVQSVMALGVTLKVFEHLLTGQVASKVYLSRASSWLNLLARMDIQFSPGNRATINVAPCGILIGLYQNKCLPMGRKQLSMYNHS